MDQNSGNKTNTQNINMVSPGTQSIQSPSNTYRTSNEQSTMNSFDCANRELQDTQDGHCPTDFAKGASMANKPDRNSDLSKNVDAISSAQSNYDSSKTYSAASAMQDSSDEQLGYQNFSSEVRLLLDSTGEHPEPQERPGRMAKLRKRNEQWKTACRKFLRLAIRGSATMRQKIETLERGAVQREDLFDAELTKCKAVHQARLANIEVKLIEYAVLQRQQDEQKQNLEKELQELKQENKELQEINAQLIKGEVPILNRYHARRAGWINTTVQQYAKTDKFSWKTTNKAEALCTKVLDDFATAHNGVKPQSLLKSCQDIAQICSESRSKLYNVNEKFDTRYQKRIKKTDRLITQEEASHFMIQIKMNDCEVALQVLQKQRQESLKESVALLEYLFRKFFADLTANDGKDWTLYNDEYEEVLEELERLEIPK